MQNVRDALRAAAIPRRRSRFDLVTISAAAAAAIAAAAAARRSLLGLVHFELAPIEQEPVELRDGRRGRLVVAHGHEREASRLPGLAIGGHRDLADFAGRSERGLDGGLGGGEREISDVETIAHLAAFLASRWAPPDGDAVRRAFDETWSNVACRPDGATNRGALPGRHTLRLQVFRASRVSRKKSDEPSGHGRSCDGDTSASARAWRAKAHADVKARAIRALHLRESG